ncbi:MAG: hypothetical protein VX278_01145 [Myxococcota bacterium]|nr:hypothetical protein [Myxococcota bacterium]
MLFFFISCYIPELTSPVDTAAATPWSCPENDWECTEPPSNLVGRGFANDEIAQDLHFYDQFDNEVSLWQFYGDVILFDISAEWCAPCKLLAEEVDATQSDYEAQGFIYLTLIAEANQSSDPVTLETLEHWAEHNHINLAPVLRTETDYRPVLTPTNAYPRLILIDRNMRVVNENIFPQNDETIREKILENL